MRLIKVAFARVKTLNITILSFIYTYYKVGVFIFGITIHITANQVTGLLVILANWQFVFSFRGQLLILRGK